MREDENWQAAQATSVCTDGNSLKPVLSFPESGDRLVTRLFVQLDHIALLSHNASSLQTRAYRTIPDFMYVHRIDHQSIHAVVSLYTVLPCRDLNLNLSPLPCPLDTPKPPLPSPSLRTQIPRQPLFPCIHHPDVLFLLPRAFYQGLFEPCGGLVGRGRVR
jgi:hypothetical protein